MSSQPSIRITFAQRPDPRQYAAAVLGCQAVLQLTGVAAQATVWQDSDLVTDEELGALTDQWAAHNPWS